jgi:hypothetical protein
MRNVKSVKTINNSLSQLAKMLSHSYYYLCLLFSKIGEKGQNRFCLEARGRKDPDNVCTYE